MRTLYPPIEPFRAGHLPVDSEHTLYFEECGNPHGTPIIFIHGGPGSGIDARHRQFFDPQHYRIILFDQRGCGKSTPHSHLKDNTTWHLVEDMEKIREHLHIKEWVLFGGSWGSTLALAYSIKHPAQVKALILRGICLCRPQELQWYYQSGANYLFPDVWQKYIEVIPPDERGDLMQAYYTRLTSPDAKIRETAALAWTFWESATLKLIFEPALMQPISPKFADAHARIECHYFINKAFFPTPNWILENISAIRHIPGTIIHGRYDVVCPLVNAWALHLAWPEAKFIIVPDAGHTASEPGILHELIEATDHVKYFLRK